MGDELELVSAHNLLRGRWLHRDGGRVETSGIKIEPDKDPLILAKQIASKLSAEIFKFLEIKKKNELIICIDQRGAGSRHGVPESIPENIKRSDFPALIFRPDLGRRSAGETQFGKKWLEILNSMHDSLADSLGSPRWTTQKKIRICGSSQLALPFFLGDYFNRNTSAVLYCSNIDQNIFSNNGQERCTILQGGNPNCEEKYNGLQEIQPDDKFDSISLFLGTQNYVSSVQEYVKSQLESERLVWVKSDRFNSSEQVMDYVADVVALLQRMKDENGLRTVHLFCGLPFHVVPLLSANLLHVITTIVFMEYRRDLQGTNPLIEDTYVPLQIHV